MKILFFFFTLPGKKRDRDLPRPTPPSHMLASPSPSSNGPPASRLLHRQAQRPPSISSVQSSTPPQTENPAQAPSSLRRRRAQAPLTRRTQNSQPPRPSSSSSGPHPPNSNQTPRPRLRRRQTPPSVVELPPSPGGLLRRWAQRPLDLSCPPPPDFAVAKLKAPHQRIWAFALREREREMNCSFFFFC